MFGFLEVVFGMSDEVKIMMVLLCELLNDGVVGGVGVIDVGGVRVDDVLGDGAFDLGEGHRGMIFEAGRAIGIID